MNSIAEFRQKGELSQSQLAIKCGISYQSLSNYENYRRRVSLVNARLIVDSLNQMGVPCVLDDVFPPTKIAA